MPSTQSNAGKNAKKAASATQMNLRSAGARSPSALACMAQALSGQKPSFLPPEPLHRGRGWGGKSILDESEG